ncbi:hypothetical protein GGI21_002867 [Coemansia aciculifera]|nr:hypothetical protein GGI21_002867 [Coemansia aciculifera]
MQSRDVESRRKSSLASIAQFFVQPIRQRLEPLMLKWIRGHKENEGNEVTDTVAKVAQQKQEGWWMRSLGTMPDQRFQVCAGRDIAPYKMGGIVKRQEEAITSQRLLRQARIANNDKNICKDDLKKTLEVLNWSAAEKSGTWMRKNSWCWTNMRDSNLRGFAIGALLGVMPVAVRE